MISIKLFNKQWKKFILIFTVFFIILVFNRADSLFAANNTDIKPRERVTVDVYVVNLEKKDRELYKGILKEAFLKRNVKVVTTNYKYRYVLYVVKSVAKIKITLTRINTKTNLSKEVNCNIDLKDEIKMYNVLPSLLNRLYGKPDKFFAFLSFGLSLNSLAGVKNANLFYGISAHLMFEYNHFRLDLDGLYAGFLNYRGKEEDSNEKNYDANLYVSSAVLNFLFYKSDFTWFAGSGIGYFSADYEEKETSDNLYYEQKSLFVPAKIGIEGYLNGVILLFYIQVNFPIVKDYATNNLKTKNIYPFTFGFSMGFDLL